MALNRPYGLKPLRKVTGEQYKGAYNTYAIPLGDTSEYRVGDPVKSAGGAFSGRTINGSVGVGIPYVEEAAAGDTLRGVIVSILPSFSDINVPFIPATKAGIYLVGVCDDPEMIFAVQADNATAYDLNYISGGADFQVDTPSPASAVSATVLDYSTSSATVGQVFQVLGLATPDSGPYAQLAVRIYLHELGGSGTGGGGGGDATAENQDIQIALATPATTPTLTRFAYTTTASTTFAAQADTNKVILMVNDADAVLYVLVGPGTCSSTNYSFQLTPNGDATSLPQSAVCLGVTCCYAVGGKFGGCNVTVLS